MFLACSVDTPIGNNRSHLLALSVRVQCGLGLKLLLTLCLFQYFPESAGEPAVESPGDRGVGQQHRCRPGSRRESEMRQHRTRSAKM